MGGGKCSDTHHPSPLTTHTALLLSGVLLTLFSARLTLEGQLYFLYTCRVMRREANSSRALVLFAYGMLCSSLWPTFLGKKAEEVETKCDHGLLLSASCWSEVRDFPKAFAALTMTGKR